MSSYLMSNYKGKYQLQAEIDQRTGDFCRDENGNLENFTDIWINCNGKGRVFHYGKNILEYYSSSLIKGKNVIKAIHEGNNDNLIFDIVETDGEVIFKFKAKDFEILEQYIKPKTNCADRSPFSTKNLRKLKEKYVIPSQNLDEYKAISALIPKDDISIYNRINNGFIEILSKKMRTDMDTLKNKIKISGMKPKEYFHSLGNEIWIKYLDYMKNYIKQGE